MRKDFLFLDSIVYTLVVFSRWGGGEITGSGDGEGNQRGKKRKKGNLGKI